MTRKKKISGTTPAFAKASALASKVVPPISRNWRVSRAQFSDRLLSALINVIRGYTIGCGGAALGNPRFEFLNPAFFVLASFSVFSG
jgi:hypothetical protein